MKERDMVHPTDRELSRRSFLKGTVLAGAGVGAMGALAACAPSGAKDDLASTGVAADSVTWDKETDIVVVGFGGAGSAAAIEARKAGAEVVILEAIQRWRRLYRSQRWSHLLGRNPFAEGARHRGQRRELPQLHDADGRPLRQRRRPEAYRRATPRTFTTGAFSKASTSLEKSLRPTSPMAKRASAWAIRATSSLAKRRKWPRRLLAVMWPSPRRPAWDSSVP